MEDGLARPDAPGALHAAPVQSHGARRENTMRDKRKLPVNSGRAPKDELERTREPFVRWRPKAQGRDDTGKRKFQRFDPSRLARDQVPEPSDDDLVQVLASMGETFALSQDRRRDIIDAAVGLGWNVANVLKYMADKPPRSELVERLEKIEAKALQLYELMDPRQSLQVKPGRWALLRLSFIH